MMTTCSKSCSHCKDVWCFLAGIVAGAVLLALFFVVPLLLVVTTGIWEILLIIVVVLVVLLALGILLKALLCLFSKHRHWT